MIARRIATEATLRDNGALAAYVGDVQKLLMEMAIEMQVIARASRARLKRAPAGAPVTYAEKAKAADEVARSLRRTAFLLSHGSRMIAKADGVIQAVFARRGRNRRRAA